MTKVLKTGARINKLAPVKSHNSYNWDLADIIFGDPLEGPSKRQEQKKAAQDRWKEKKAAREQKRDTRQDMQKRFGPV